MASSTRLTFDEQVSIIVRDLSEHFWHEDAKVVGNSFGAYLFLHAQSQLPSFIGRVLLLSPIVGKFSNKVTGVGFLPLRPDRLSELAEAGQFNAPKRCEIHVGEQDWQSIPASVQAFVALTDIPVTVVPENGHRLERQYVGELIDRWLTGLEQKPT